MTNVILAGLSVFIVGFTLGYYSAMVDYKRISDSWKGMYYESRKEIDSLRMGRKE